MNERAEDEFAAAFRRELARRREPIQNLTIDDVEALRRLRQELWDDQVEIGRRYVVPRDVRLRIQVDDIREIDQALRARWPDLFVEAFPPNSLRFRDVRLRGPFRRFRLRHCRRRLRRRVAG